MPFSYRLEHIRAYYEGYEAMMSAFKPLYEDRIYELSYELLVADFENQAKALMNYLDIDWHEDCGNFHRTKRTVKTASYAQVRTPLYVKAMRRFEHYREYLAPVLELERFWKAPQP